MKFDAKWRLLAGVATLIYIMIFFAVIRLALGNILLVIAVALTASALIYTSWLVFTGNRKQQRRGYWLFGATVAALLVEIFLFVREARNFKSVVVIMLFGAVYLYLFNILRKEYLQEKYTRNVAARHPKFKHPYLIINPKSGNGRATKAHTAEAAEELGITCLVLQKDQSMELLAKKAVSNGADILGVSGGDGSIGSVAKIAMKHHLPLVVLPGGTRCHFAKDIGLEPKRINDALVAFRGIERRVDAGSINGRIFLNNASFGLYADIVNHPDYRDNKLQVSRDTLQKLLSGKMKPYDLRVNQDGYKFSRAVMILIGVNRYNTINLIELGRREKLDDGILQINVLAKMNDRIVRSLLRIMSMSSLKSSTHEGDFYQWDTKSFRVTSNRKEIIVGVDGESERYKTPVNVKCLPSALRLYVPPEGVRSHSRNRFSLKMFREIWRVAKN